MKINVGAMDRALRVGVGALLIGLAASDVVGLWGSIGAVPLLTGLFRFCPACGLFGLSACALERG